MNKRGMERKTTISSSRGSTDWKKNKQGHLCNHILLLTKDLCDEEKKKERAQKEFQSRITAEQAEGDEMNFAFLFLVVGGLSSHIHTERQITKRKRKRKHQSIVTATTSRRKKHAQAHRTQTDFLFESFSKKQNFSSSRLHFLFVALKEPSVPRTKKHSRRFVYTMITYSWLNRGRRYHRPCTRPSSCSVSSRGHEQCDGYPSEEHPFAGVWQIEQANERPMKRSADLTWCLLSHVSRFHRELRENIRWKCDWLRREQFTYDRRMGQCMHEIETFLSCPRRNKRGSVDFNGIG